MGGTRNTGARYNWHKNKSGQGSRIIIFILGGMFPNEMRSAYEVSTMFEPKKDFEKPHGSRRENASFSRMKAGDKKSIATWEVVLGSTSKQSPSSFLECLAEI